MADKVFQLKWYCNTGVCPFGAHVRQRCGLWLNPLSSTKTMMRPCFWAFFNLRPALLFPSPDGLLVPLQSSSHRPLATPTQLPQNAPSLRGMVAHPAFLLDQVRHPPRRPQTCQLPSTSTQRNGRLIRFPAKNESAGVPRNSTGFGARTPTLAAESG